MKRLSVALLLFTLIPNQISFAAKVTPGTACKKIGTQEVYKGKIFTCIKLGKKLYWDNGLPFQVSPTPKPLGGSSLTPAPSTSTLAKPTTSPSPNQTTPTPLLPLLREVDVAFRSAKLTVTWSGLGVDQTLLSNLRRINLWILDSQINPLVGPVWRVAGFIPPDPGASFQITLPNREHSVRISAVFLSGQETGYSQTIRVVPNPVQISKPTDVVAEWDKTDFKVKFNHNSNEEYLSTYKIRLDAGGSSKILEIKPSSSSSGQIFVLSLQGNQSLFGPAQTVISGSVRTVDIFGKEGEEVRFPAPVYKTTLPSP